MRSVPHSPPAHARRKPRLLRWAALATVSILLHLAVLNWAEGSLDIADWRTPAETVVSAELKVLPPPPLPPQAAPAKSAESNAKRPRKARPKPADTSKPATMPAYSAPSAPPDSGIRETVIAMPQQLPPSDPFASIDLLPGIGSEETVATAAASDMDVSPQKIAAPTQYSIDPPPSVELKYDVQALRGAETVYGKGKISWQSEGVRYTVQGEAGILFFTLLTFRSEGLLDDLGVSPVLYAEKRFRRSETNTHFHRERNIISFSASQMQYPRKGGEQDRASLIWQLAGIGRGDSAKFVPGAEIDLFVAGVRDAETWRIQVLGLEEIDVDGEKMASWHVVRTPRPGSYDQKLDIWLAPQHEWYPVKLRYTERNGDYLDLLLSDMRAVSAAAEANTSNQAGSATPAESPNLSAFTQLQ